MPTIYAATGLSFTLKYYFCEEKKKILTTYGSPSNIDKIAKTFLSKKFTNLQSVPTAKRDSKHVKQTYMGYLSYEIRKQIKTLAK